MERKWYQKPSNWLSIAVIAIIIPILALNISIMIQAATNKNEVPSIFGYKPFIVLSGSMESEIMTGDLVIVKETDPEKLNKKDIIAFRDAQDTVTTHRIIDIVYKDGQKYFVTKGDNNSSQDQNLVELEDVEGIYEFRIPRAGSIFNSLAKPTTIIIIILCITVIFGLGFYSSAKKQLDADRKEFEEFKKIQQLKTEQEKQEELEEITEKKTKKTSTSKTTASKKSTSTKKTSDSSSKITKENKNNSAKSGKISKEAENVKPESKKTTSIKKSSKK